MGRNCGVVGQLAGIQGADEAQRKQTFEHVLQSWRKAGFLRVLIDGKELRLDAALALPKETASVDLVIDRVTFDAASRSRIADAVAQAAAVSGGRVSALSQRTSAAGKRLDFSTQGACPVCGFRLDHRLDPRHFSFNTHAGACVECDSLGAKAQCDGTPGAATGPRRAARAIRPVRR